MSSRASGFLENESAPDQYDAANGAVTPVFGGSAADRGIENISGALNTKTPQLLANDSSKHFMLSCESKQ